MRVNIIIETQLQENYGSLEQPCWKNKGGRVVLTTLDSDIVMHADPEAIISAIETLLESLNSYYFRYLYQSHSEEFLEPIVIEGDALDKLVQQEIKQVRG
jgi:hypothetical protein